MIDILSIIMQREFLLLDETEIFLLRIFKVVKGRHNENHYRVDEPVKRI